ILPSLEDHETLNAVCGAMTLVVIVLLTAALRQPDIDSALTARVIARRAVGMMTAVALVLLGVPGFGEFLGTSPMSAAASPLSRAGQAVLGLAWFLLAVAYTFRGLRVGRALHAWFGLMLFGLALAAISGAGTTPTHTLWPIGAAVLSLVAMVLAMYGATQELRRGWRAQQERLWQARVDLEREHIRREDDELQRQEQRHDARSAIVAIQAAAFVLEAGDDDLDDVERAGLARSLAAEVTRLQQLVENVNAATEPVVFDVQAALEPTLTCHRSGDLGLLAQIPPGLQARGRPNDLARAVQNLLDNTRRHAPGSPVLVTAGLEGGNVVVRVEDRGPGVLPSELEAIFERGRRGSNAGPGGSGLGMHVARQLMREQGGDLWVEGRPGGGASFVLFLEAEPIDASTDELTPSSAPAVPGERPAISGGRGA
ncbi:MAG TPA: sensor histidine kinase, partial [Acidimicrobiia bacterium]|nr:sensor histidine kinase [Acidimicrobiia bacterium]